MVTVISRFRVRNGLEQEVRTAFLNRPRLVENSAGFRGLDVLTESADPSVFLLVTRWTDEESFRTWHRSEAHQQSHELMPQGLKLDAAFTSLTVANSIEDPAGIQNLADALADQTPALAAWVMGSDAVFALLLTPDGAIRARNRAGDRIFPPDPATNFGSSVWDYLICSDSQPLRQGLADGGYDGCLRLNLADGLRTPITLEAAMVPCRGAMLLLGTEENRHDLHFQNELLKLTNDLSVAMRESARKNRELKEANDTIDRLARTDALTGLANRRTLDEALQREMARAKRLGLALSVIFADLDHFKSLNDQYGHGTGDQALARVAVVFGTGSRPYDLVARYGGEEFVLLLPGACTADALGIAERIRKEVAQCKIPDCDGTITVSLGVASWMSGETSEKFLARADAALYEAKRSGRNRVQAALEVRA